MSLCQTFGWSTDVFFDKLEAFCMKYASSKDPDAYSNQDQWNVLSDIKITEFMSQLKREEKHSNSTKPRLAQTPQRPAFKQGASPQKILMVYNSHLSDEQKEPLTCVPQISIPSDFALVKCSISSSPRSGAISADTHMENLVSRVSLEWSHPGAFSAESINTFGRLCSDVSDNAKWNEKSIVLETTRSLASGHRVKCHIGNLSSFSFFPGQIIAARGKVLHDGFMIDQLIPLPPLERPVSPLHELVNQKYRLLDILVCCGPFNSVQHLDNCFSQVTQNTNALILMGPFIDQDLEKKFLDEEIYGEFKLFLERFQSILQVFVNLSIVLVPNVRDMFHFDVSMPQEPFDIPNVSHKRLFFMPNPSMFAIEEVIIGLTSADIIFDLSAFEISRKESNEPQENGAKSTDRMSKLCKHILDQRHFYPLHPSSPLCPMKNGFCTGGMSIPMAPDVMILPSQHRHFVKNVDNVLCINPGKVCRSSGGGSMARLIIHPLKINDRAPEFTPHLVESRCRVDIISVNGT